MGHSALRQSDIYVCKLPPPPPQLVQRPEDAYRNMSMALNATGRPIYFLTCEWGVDDPWQWMR